MVAGLVSGMLGVGGGIVIVPMLVLLAGLTQHRAHATSLAAVIPIAMVGSLTFLSEGRSEPLIALPLALGALVGAPLGVKMMASMPERRLKLAFGVILFVTGVFLAWP